MEKIIVKTKHPQAVVLLPEQNLEVRNGIPVEVERTQAVIKALSQGRLVVVPTNEIKVPKTGQKEAIEETIVDTNSDNTDKTGKDGIDNSGERSSKRQPKSGDKGGN